jgi:hypothetical protein
MGDAASFPVRVQAGQEARAAPDLDIMAIN